MAIAIRTTAQRKGRRATARAPADPVSERHACFAYCLGIARRCPPWAAQSQIVGTQCTRGRAGFRGTAASEIAWNS